jgi:hypothetical protein
MTPKPKPKNYSKILDVLNTPQAAKTFSPKTYIDLVGQYSRKAFDNGEISKKEYMSIVKPLFGDAGIMATKKIDEYREKFSKGSKPDYWSMVTRKFIEAGGEKKTGMSINEFAQQYFPKMAQGGRIGYNEGSPDVAELRKRVEELMDDGETFGDAVKKAVKELENG